MYVLPYNVAQTLYGLLAKVSLGVTSPTFLTDAQKLDEAKVELEKVLKYYEEQKPKAE